MAPPAPVVSQPPPVTFNPYQQPAAPPALGPPPLGPGGSTPPAMRPPPTGTTPDPVMSAKFVLICLFGLAGPPSGPPNGPPTSAHPPTHLAPPPSSSVPGAPPSMGGGAPAVEELGPDMEGGDAPAPPTAAMGKMSLDHSKRVYPQQAYTGR